MIFNHQAEFANYSPNCGCAQPSSVLAVFGHFCPILATLLGYGKVRKLFLSTHIGEQLLFSSTLIYNFDLFWGIVLSHSPIFQGRMPLQRYRCLPEIPPLARTEIPPLTQTEIPPPTLTEIPPQILPENPPHTLPNNQPSILFLKIFSLNNM